MSALPAGWGWPTLTATKAHYWREGENRSLCGKYGRILVTVEPDNGPSPDDCKPCRRKLEQEQAIGRAALADRLAPLIHTAIDTSPVDHIVTKQAAAELTDHIIRTIGAGKQIDP